MKYLAIFAAIMSFIAFVFATWDRNLILALANFNTIVWAILYAFKD